MSGPSRRLGAVSVSLPPLEEAIFLQRSNRFVGMIQVAGSVYPGHVPSSGRMGELLFPGNRVFVSPMPPGKRTNYKINLAQQGETLVSIDSLLPNNLMYKAFSLGALDEFCGFRDVKKEIGYGESRMDFLLSGDRGHCLVEVKSVTLVEYGVAKFPDAPSERGSKHLRELTKAVGEGLKAAVIFVTQREDAHYFSPNFVTDPTFSRELYRAASAGVDVLALSCKVDLGQVALNKNVLVRI